METVYCLNLGFDRDLMADPGNQNLPLLQYGFTKQGVEGNPVAIARNLLKGHDLCVALYDLTKSASVENIDQLSLEIVVQKARSQDHDSPFSLPSSSQASSAREPTQIPYSRYAINRGMASVGHSRVFDGEYPVWNVYPPTNVAKTFPDNQLTGEISESTASFSLVNRGAFYLTIELKVRHASDGSVIHFRVDPEMIIDNNGSFPPDHEPIPH